MIRRKYLIAALFAGAVFAALPYARGYADTGTRPRSDCAGQRSSRRGVYAIHAAQTSRPTERGLFGVKFASRHLDA